MDWESDLRPWQTPLALLLIRLGLAWFLFVWGVNKFLAPKQTVAIWGYFYGIEIDVLMSQLFGAGEVVLALAIAIGLARPVSYAAGFAIHAVTVIVILDELVAPFVVNDNGYPVNRNNSVAVPVLVAFAGLWLMRTRDSWSLDAWWRRRRQATP